MADSKSNGYIELMTVRVMKYLESKMGICQLKNEVHLPAERPAVLMWEQKHSLLLPEDLKNFFLTSNGFHLTWSVKMENLTIPVGTMHINSVTQLTRLDNGVREGSHVQPSLWDLDFVEDEESGGKQVPSFVDSRIFELDPCDGYGKVCLVFNECKPGDSGSDSGSDIVDSGFNFAFDFVTEIWFLDRSLRWHFICDTFMEYFRLMLMHLGIPQWQFAFTDIGLPPPARQWFNMYAPIRLEVDVEGALESHTPRNEIDRKAISSPLDLNKIFKGKSDRKKLPVTQSTPSTTTVNAAKRKPPVSSARSSTSMVKQTGPSNTTNLMKSSR